MQLNETSSTTFRPEILAPAGDRQAFLAALAAGADAVYCGLKHFSARMEAENFSLRELADLTRLAHSKGRKVLVAMNTLLKPRDLTAAGHLVDQLQRHVHPDGLILQDLGLLELTRQAGFSGEVHLSTLACVSTASGLETAAQLGVRQVVLPRELHLDEIKQMAQACPSGMNLEVFVHGALCYAVSGRCYWSSYMGGKSGLRGRCVQPCRRVYNHEGRLGSYFSCQDLSLDVLVKTLLDIPEVRTWKIEGRKKSAHYVFYTVTAYRLLRDEGNSVRARKEAAALLEMALGRPGSHAGFLPQRKYTPLAPNTHLASGLLAGHIPKDAKTAFIRPRLPLHPGDLLRLGSEDQPWHRVLRVTRFVPKGGRFDLAAEQGKKASERTKRSFHGRPGGATPRSTAPPPGAAVWLIDRREPELKQLIQQLEVELNQSAPDEVQASSFTPVMPRSARFEGRGRTMIVSRRPRRSQEKVVQAMWLDPKFLEHMGRETSRRLCWWLPPVIWQDEEHLWRSALEQVQSAGARFFVCNAPWQISLFNSSASMTNREIWAGPFCNTANALAIAQLRELGFNGAVVSPELDEESFLILPEQAGLPLGIITEGLWPFCVSRLQAEELVPEKPLASPKGEIAWARKYQQNLWVYPDWTLDLHSHREKLESAGYRLFIQLEEKLPPGMNQRPRTSPFNWNLRLL
ncbi:peptidase U32 family protein [Desulfonatronum parangueonense]